MATLGLGWGRHGWSRRREGELMLVAAAEEGDVSEVEPAT